MDISAVSQSYLAQAQGALAGAGLQAAPTQSGAELKKACVEFEAYFLNAIFKEMRKTTFSGEKKSFAQQTWQEMADDATARLAAESGGIGLAAFMYRQMSKDSGAAE
jgi:flagellar protein FlgJ